MLTGEEIDTWDMPSYDELLRMERGHEFIYKGIRRTVYYAEKRKGGGSGMGEYPPTVTVVFSGGLVIDAGPEGWYKKGRHCRVVHEPFGSADHGF